MALNIFPRLPLRTFGGSFAPLSTCRWNSTNADAISYLQSATRPTRGPKPYHRTALQNRARIAEEQKKQAESRALERFQTREWRAGDVYAPHDLSPAQMRKWKVRHSPPTDAFDAIDKNPLDLYKNFSIMSEYMTPMGRIKHRSETGLRPVNQRKIAKAIRRAIGLGLMPSVHRHPEILAAEAKARLDGNSNNVY
ncbi:hypothetical protein SI65_08735 [Aspergillus cristatus]|uniref:Small ribosomal subunit protein bS18m n=1 Tax=Aspergillus cristatus TaxID=573508 RepID=A0A1E3B4Q6_ASPCR|nr:hypothetical protein SI65_08735 [Aspergillus cristatus]